MHESLKTTKSRRNGRLFGLVVLAGWVAQSGLARAVGLAEAASADGPAEMPSVLHALTMLAVFFVLASLRVTKTKGRLRVSFDISPIRRPVSREKRMVGGR